MPAPASEPPKAGWRISDPAGDVLDGRYAVGDLLGSGGMAEVRRGHDQLLDRDVAIKLFRGRPDSRPTERERAEAQLLASLDHPGLVKVHDVGHSPTSGWVVMDLVDGPDLHRLLRSGPLGTEQTWAIGHDVARTLAYVHAKGITHRDVKPSNILTRDAEPSSGRFGYVLTDFGIARRADSDRLTATGETIGTAAYFSPEQARGEAVGAATDIYALGLVLLECLTGEPAFEGHGLETALARLHRAPAIPASVNPAWRDLIADMTAGTPTERPSAAEVAGILSAQRNAFLVDSPAADGAGPETMVMPGAAGDTSSTRRAFVLGLNEQPAPQPAPIERRPASTNREPVKRNRRWWVAAAVVVLLVLVALSVVLSGLLNQAPTPEPLPEVPGVPGERLSELYESVQP
jgi:serine/threonine protein kinase